MTLTRAQLISRAASRIGAKVGDISSGTSTTAVLAGLVNGTGDNSTYQDWLLFMLDAANEADKEKRVEVWEDADGRARFAIRTDTSYSSETFILAPPGDYSLAEYRDKLNVALRETKRTYRQIITPSPNATLIPIADLTWLDGADDIDQVWVSESPNLLHNEDFAYWSDGTAEGTAPDGWTVTADSVITRGTDGMRSGYSATVTSVGTAVELRQAVRKPVQEYLLRSAQASLPTMYAGAWVTCDTASVSRVGIDNGTSITYGSYHTGTGEPQWVTHSRATTAADEDMAIVLNTQTTGEAIWHAAAFTTSAVPAQLKDYGSHGYSEREINARPRNIGSGPVLELAQAQSGQLVVYARRGAAPLTADSDEIDEQYARALEAGLLCKLLEVRKPNQDRTRLDVILAEQRSMWNRLNKNFIDLPVPTPPRQYVIAGA